MKVCEFVRMMAINHTISRKEAEVATHIPPSPMGKGGDAMGKGGDKTDKTLQMGTANPALSTALTASNGSVPIFTGSSPDEIAFVAGARFLGYEFDSRSAEQCFVREPLREPAEPAEPAEATERAEAERNTYRILAHMGFDNERKRSSVVVERPDGECAINRL
jgi:magnesium-transporting ATPase (P-type)